MAEPFFMPENLKGKIKVFGIYKYNLGSAIWQKPKGKRKVLEMLPKF